MMSDHIQTEEMSALLDEGMPAGDAAEHLEECPACRREMELMRRTRMALSALDELEPPPGQWEAIEATLERRGVLDSSTAPGRRGATAAPGDGPASPGPGQGRPGGRRDEPHGARAALLPGGAGWMRAAAAVLLFAGGVGAGLTLGTGSGGPSPAEDGSREVAAAAAADREASGASPERTAGQDPPRLTSAAEAGPSLDGSSRPATAEGYRRALDRLEALRAQGPSPGEVYRNPGAAAEHLARLDALIRASREALREDPADPALNDFLFEVVEQRQQLNQALQLASLEYK